MIHHDGLYYYCESRDQHRSIAIRKAKTITSIGTDPGVTVWTAPARGRNSQSIWAPELHRINGRWFIYYAADDGRNVNHRMWVLEAEGQDPLGPYHCRGELNTQGWAIDGTVLNLDNGKLFLVWSGWPGRRDGHQNLYIAPMEDPVTVSGPRSLLCKPEHAWERVAMPICEGPQVLKRNGSLFIVYSASASWTPDYCLGMLAYRKGDLLNPLSWEKHGPVFQKTEHVWGVGHCSFVKSPCRSEDWIIYHSKSQKTNGWMDRDVHAKKFDWDSKGFPVFGAPPPRASSVLTPLTPAEPSSLLPLQVSPLAFPTPEKAIQLDNAHV